MKKTYRWKGKDREFEVRPMDTSNWEECDVQWIGVLCGHAFDERMLEEQDSPNYLVNVKFSKKCREHDIKWACEWCFDMISQTIHELGYSYL